MKPIRRVVLVRTLGAGLALLLALGAWELVLRARARHLASDMEAGWDRAPRSFYRTRASPWAQGHADPLRVAVIGDSIANGQGVQSDDTFALRLERLLNMNEGVRPAEMKLWACGGLSTYHETRFLPEMSEWRPHLLILEVCLNDTEDTSRSAIGLMHAWRADMALPLPPPWLARVLRHTRVGEWLWVRSVSGRAARGEHDYYLRLFDRNYSGWGRFEAALQGFRETCAETNTKLVVVIFPLLSRVDRYPYDGIHQQLHQALEKERIEYLDLLDEFCGRLPDRLQVVPLLDAHPNEIAHRLAADAIFKFLLDRSLVDKAYAPTVDIGSRIKHWRNLARSLQDPLAPEPTPDP